MSASTPESPEKPWTDPMGGDPDQRRSASSRLAWPLIVLLLAGVVAIGLSILADTIPKLHHVRIGATRTPVPGSRDARLQAGKYVIYYEVADSAAVPSASWVAVRIAAPGRAPLALDNYSSDLELSTSNTQARAYLTVQVPRPGTYRIAAAPRSAPPAGTQLPRIVLGRPTGTTIIRLVLGALMTLVGFVLFIGFLSVWLVYKR